MQNKKTGVITIRIAINYGRKSRGDTSPPPHDFEGGGHNIKCPPPHVFGVVRLFIEMRTLFIIVSRRCFFFFGLSARILNKIRCGNNVAQITAIPIELH